MQKTNIEELYSLLDGVTEIVELYKPQSPAQIKWKEDWLNRTNNALSKYLALKQITNKIIKEIDYDINISNLCLRHIHVNLNYAKVNGYFDCSCNELTSLEGCPKIVNGTFYCYGNNLKSLKGCPEVVSGNFYCHSNKVKFTKRDVRKHCKVGQIIFV